MSKRLAERVSDALDTHVPLAVVLAGVGIACGVAAAFGFAIADFVE